MPGDKTDPESEDASVGSDDEPSDMQMASSEIKMPRRRRIRRGRRRKKSQTIMVLQRPPQSHVVAPKIYPFQQYHPNTALPDYASQIIVRPPMRRWSSPVTASHHYSLDCEMVGVGPFGRRSVLARVSMVKWNGLVVLDTFVKVEEPVTDYRTFVSGIRPCDLTSPNALEYGECRTIVQNLLRHKILVGHGLENDLKVLRISHPWHMIRDTATYEPFMKWTGSCHGGKFRARRLKDLALAKLGVAIQGKEHDSIEDARCAMELYKRVQREWDYNVAWKRNMEIKMGAY